MDVLSNLEPLVDVVELSNLLGTLDPVPFVVDGVDPSPESSLLFKNLDDVKYDDDGDVDELKSPWFFNLSRVDGRDPDEDVEYLVPPPEL